MKSLADEILDFIPTGIHGVEARRLVSMLSADRSSIRRACNALNNDGRAVIVRRCRVLYLVRSDAGLTVCRNCQKEFDRQPKSKRATCSRHCAIAWSWKNPVTAENRKTAIRAERQSPEAKSRLAAHNQRRWSKPGAREKLSEQNRREWADPAKAAKRAASIRAVNGSKEFRKRCSEIRKAYWNDPEQRDKMLAAIGLAQKSEKARANHSTENRRRYSEPASRERYLEVSRKNIAKATAAITGKKQTPEHVRKRTAAARVTREAERLQKLNHQPGELHGQRTRC